MNTDKSKAPTKNFLYKQLRKHNTLEEINDKRGNTVVLNLAKRIVFDRPYKNPEYEAERVRRMKKIMSQLQENNTEEKGVDNGN